jgi:hypothetical protein
VCTEENLAEASIDPMFAPSLIPRFQEGMLTGQGRMRDESLSNIDFSRTMIAQENSTSEDRSVRGPVDGRSWL